VLNYAHGKEKITLEMLAAGLAKMDARMEKGFASVEAKLEKTDVRMERGFAAIADDIADIKRDMATKEHIVALHTQVNSIETQLRGMQHTKLQSRVADVEEELFGKSRA
jgi:hypothetical protein